MEASREDISAAEGGRKATLQDIASHLDISPATASRALSGKGRISPAVRRKVIDYAGEIGYQPRERAKEERVPSADTLARGPMKTDGGIGVVLPRDLLYDSSFFSQCLLGIAEIATGNDRETVIVLSDSGSYTDVRRSIQRGSIAGMVLTRTVRDDPCAEYLKREGIPAVVIGSSQYDLPQVDMDTVQACREMTEYLYTLSGRSIAFLGGDMGYTVNQNRYEGYRMALSGHGGIQDPLLIHHYLNDRGGVRTAVDQTLGMRAGSILCGDDVLCEMVMAVLEEKGIRVPEDIYLASCYDSRLMLERTPAVTAISSDPREEGMSACRVLLSMLRGDKVDKVSRMEYSIHLRASTRRQERR